MRRSNVLLSCALLAAACGPDLPQNVDAGPPLIRTPSPLPDAVFDVDYSLQLEWSGGQEPFTFRIEAPRALAAWLSIDEAEGMLTGRPDAVLNPGIEFTVTVTDSVGQSDAKVFTLAVAKCNKEGLEVDCFTVDTFRGQCLQNKALCTNGTFATCDPGEPSLDFDHCGLNAIGTACGSCSPATADKCNGECKCGSSPACIGDKPTCCGSKCVDTTSGDTSNCGACGKTCPAGPDNSSLACSESKCSWSCNGPYSQCGSSCINLSDNAGNCGACGKTCAVANAPGGATCSGGGCRWPATVNAADGLHIRSDPHTTASSLGILVNNTLVHIDCQIRGDSAGGTTLWDHVIEENGHAKGYMSDAYLSTGTSSQFAPTCQ